MMRRASAACGVVVIVLAAAAVVAAQAPSRPVREFAEFRGAWILDEAAGQGRIGGLPVAKTLVIATTTTEISIAKDKADPEIYRVDGTETQRRDAGTGVRLQHFYRFTLVADALALTFRETRGTAPEVSMIVTDAYSVAGDVLTVERQHSSLRQPPGHLVILSEPRNNRQTMVYRRAKP
jgi:hypothetical protein